LSALTGRNNVIIADFKKKSSVFLKKIQKNDKKIRLAIKFPKSVCEKRN